MNVAMTAAGGFVELQGTAEGRPFVELDGDGQVVRRAAPGDDAPVAG